MSGNGGSVTRTLDEWLAYQQTLLPVGMMLGLERVRRVAASLQLPRTAKWIISVAGTNGKGSTVSFVDAIARAAGLRVGTYTSPHLLRYTERIRIDGNEVEQARLLDAFERIERARADTPLTYFEFGTLAALLIFAETSLDLAVLEVGLGGRLDAVNLVDADVAILTSVSLDHTEHLGTNREAIGVEKAGIFRAARPAVLGEALPPLTVLAEIERLGAVALRAGLDFRATTSGKGDWTYEDSQGSVQLPPPALQAPCQIGNAAAALAALRHLPKGPVIAPAAAAHGVANVRLAGRLQRLPGPVEVLLDVAHNPQAATELARWLARNRPRGATQAVFSALADKDIPRVVAAMMGVIDVWRFAGLPHVAARGLDADGLWRVVAGLLSKSISSRHQTVADALTEALSHAEPGDRVVVFGSFHTVAEAMRVMGSDS
ncbi:MAG: bifunctional tetrahydrofolate synthase/dihydrofolate synthase [Pseudomarimonas sp.]